MDQTIMIDGMQGRTSVNLKRRGSRALSLYILGTLALSGCGGGGGSEPPPVDTTPPAAPTGLTVQPGDGVALLTWEANSEEDLAGYRLYRTTPPDTTRTVVGGADPLQATYLLDGTLSNATGYAYILTALDLVGNESDDSTEVAVTPADPVRYAGSGFKLVGMPDNIQGPTWATLPRTVAFPMDGGVWLLGDDGLALVSSTSTLLASAGHPSGMDLGSPIGLVADSSLVGASLQFSEGWCDLRDADLPEHAFLADPDPDGWTVETQVFAPHGGRRVAVRAWEDPQTLLQSAALAVLAPDGSTHERVDYPFYIEAVQLAEGRVLVQGAPSTGQIYLAVAGPEAGIEFEYTLEVEGLQWTDFWPEIDPEYLMFFATSASTAQLGCLDLSGGDLNSFQVTSTGPWESLQVLMRPDVVLIAHRAGAFPSDVCGLASFDWNGDLNFELSLRGTPPGPFSGIPARPVAFYNKDGATPVLLWEEDDANPMRYRPYTAIDPQMGVIASITASTESSNLNSATDIVGVPLDRLVLSGFGPNTQRKHLTWTPGGSVGSALETNIKITSIAGFLYGEQSWNPPIRHYGIFSSVSPPVWGLADWGTEGDATPIIRPRTIIENGAGGRYCLGIASSMAPDLVLAGLDLDGGLTDSCLEASPGSAIVTTEFAAFTPIELAGSGLSAEIWFPVPVQWTEPVGRDFSFHTVPITFPEKIVQLMVNCP